VSGQGGDTTVDTLILEQVAPRRFDDEDLHRQVGIDVVVALERDHAASGELLHGADRLALDGVLKRAAAVQHDLGLAVVDQALLAFGHRRPHDAHDDVLSPVVVRALVGPRPV
jgi:hypothetical protein